MGLEIRKFFLLKRLLFLKMADIFLDYTRYNDACMRYVCDASEYNILNDNMKNEYKFYVLTVLFFFELAIFGFSAQLVH